MTSYPTPEMVRVTAGDFVMGSPGEEGGRLPVEGPQHRVSIAKAFALGKFAVTVDEFAAFVTISGYPGGTTCRQWTGTDFDERPGSFLAPGFVQHGRHPAVCVSWNDARAYAAWLSEATGRLFRLPSEAEWEYSARAGTTTPYPWGLFLAPDRANYNFAKTAPGVHSDAWLPATVSVDSFAANRWGLHQMHGNVWEWVDDAWAASYESAPDDGSARPALRDGDARVLRGGSWLNGPHGLRSARRHAAPCDFRRSDTGFRLAETL
jgi:formylglycine-generating enzyme required for sulfatase activity